MRAYYHDNLPGDSRLPHDSGRPVTREELAKLGVIVTPIDLENYEPALEVVSKERDYVHNDRASLSKRESPSEKEWHDTYSGLYKEHLHQDEEIRYITEGSGYYDVRESPSEEWIRVFVEPGDLVILPVGVYHRFTVDFGEHIAARRLYKEQYDWDVLIRGDATEANPFRHEYLKAIGIAA